MEEFQIGIVGLGKGEVSYYDPLSKVHLTLHYPTANIYSYMNTSRLRRAVINKTIRIIAGTLAVPTSFMAIPEEETSKRIGIDFNKIPKDSIEMKPIQCEGIVEENIEKTIKATKVPEEEKVAKPKKATTKKKKEEV